MTTDCVPLTPGAVAAITALNRNVTGSVTQPIEIAARSGDGSAVMSIAAVRILRGDGVTQGLLPIARWLCVATICFAVTGLAARLTSSSANAGPSPEEYVAHVGGSAVIVPGGDLRLDGRKAVCGHRPTVLDNSLDDYGAAYPGFLILNPRLMNKVSTPVKMWIYAHECGHQFRGPDEETADCFAVQRGRRQGWLTEEGLDEVCRFISPAKGDSMHFSGSHRCAQMRRCYADPAIK